MKRVAVLVSFAVALSGQPAFAQHRLTDPIKIARECKVETELYCKDVRPGRKRVVRCLKEKESQLSLGCLNALKSARQ